MDEMPSQAEAEQELLMLGTPHTGKTSFLALFYLALVNARCTRLRLASWFGDREHLNDIADRLLRCTSAARTPTGEQRQLDLPLIAPDDRVVRLRVPDLSGEVWQEALLHRQWPADLDQRVHEAQAKLLFLHADEVDAGPSINAVHQLARSLGATEEDVVATAPAQQPSVGSHGGFPGRPPTQVDLVDLIQLTCEQRGQRPARLCLVISAWDYASGTPADFVARNLPLLAQYIEANATWLRCEVFGVSAQGGRFDEEEARERLAAQDALERAIIRTADGGEAEVGTIVEWALGLG